MKNMLWYLGFLSLLSLLFLVEGKVGFLGFLGFLPYFSIYKTGDERIEKNIGRATRNAFIYTILFGSCTLAYGYLTKNTKILLPAFSLLFGGTLIVCLLSLFYYDKTGK
ncbi:MAG: DUF3796 domain-containing protein [Candidatus Altiarchaeota archaeon]